MLTALLLAPSAHAEDASEEEPPAEEPPPPEEPPSDTEAEEEAEAGLGGSEPEVSLAPISVGG